MSVRIQFDLADVTFLRDIAEAHINEIQESIKKMECADHIDEMRVELWKTSLNSWEGIYAKLQATLKRMGWD